MEKTRSPRKSPSDLKEYRLLTLANGLEVLLVSSKELKRVRGVELSTCKAAAGLCVQAGSFSDPIEAQGCAHFLEHMVFMGSRKYPKENQYDTFINSHGGYANAMTEGEFTVYQFEVTAEFFSKALDMFAQCFISPLLRMDASDREINAIESEFKLATTSDNTRLDELLCQAAVPGHVVRKFGWGNKKSLSVVPKASGVEIQPLLKAFHKTHYLAPNMKLVVLAPKTLDALQADVEQAFGAWDGGGGDSSPEDGVKAKGKGGKGAKPDEPTPLLPTQESLLSPLRGLAPFPADACKFLTRIVPTMRSHKLHMTWVLPPQLRDYRSKSAHYVSHLVGHEGAGSLLKRLKGAGLAMALSAGLPEDCLNSNSMFSLFRLSVTLTAQGLSNWMQVARHVHLYLSMLRRQGPQRWVFDELQRVGRIDFDYLEEDEEEAFVENACIEMSPGLGRERSDLLSAQFEWRDWDPAAVEGVLARMTARNAIVSLSSCSFADALPVGAGDEEEGEEEEEEEEDEGEWEDEDEDEDEEEDEEDEGGKGAGKAEEREATVLSAAQIQAAYLGPVELLPLVLPPAAAPSVDQHFGTKCWRDPLPEELLRAWERPEEEQEESAGLLPLHLPPPNPFLPGPEGLAFVPCDGPASIVEAEEAMADAEADEAEEEEDEEEEEEDEEVSGQGAPVPVVVVRKAGVTAWHTLDARFPVPKVELFIQCSSPASSSSATAAMCTDLLCSLLLEALNETLYMASMAELSGSVSATDLGLTFRVQGFSDKALVLGEGMLGCLLRALPASLDEPGAAGAAGAGAFAHNPNVDVHANAAAAAAAAAVSLFSPSAVALCIETLTRSYSNDGMKSAQASTSARLLALLPGRHGARAKLAALTELLASAGVGAVRAPEAGAEAEAGAGAGSTEEEEESRELVAARVSIVTAALLSHLRSFLSCLAFEVLSHGNLSSASVAAFTDTLEGMCRWPPSNEACIGRAVTKLPQGAPMVLSQAPRNPEEPSLCCEMYYQLGPYSDLSVVLLDLLEAVLEEPFFDQLRTKQQLGYSVGCGCKNTFGVVGFAFSVVSSSFSMDHVQAAILTFAQSVPGLIRAMPKADWKDHLEALISEKEAPDTALSGAAAFNWDEISDQRFDFTSRAKHAKMLADVSKEDLAALAEGLLAPATRKLLAVQVQVDGEPVPVSSVAASVSGRSKGKGKAKGAGGKSKAASASAAAASGEACIIVSTPAQVWATCEVQLPAPRA